MDQKTKVFIAKFTNSGVKTKKKVFISKTTQISTNTGIKSKQEKDFISKTARIFTNSGVKPQKKESLLQKLQKKKQFLHTNCGAITITLGVSGLELHSCGTELVTFFGAQFSFGVAQAVIWGGTAPECPTVAPGLS